MAKPDLQLWHWNEIVPTFHEESDRGAGVLAGGFVDEYLSGYLRWKMVNKKVGEELFAPLGPLNSFSQKIACAYAFGFIPKQYYLDLTAIRRVRNHFAHHPFDSTFGTKNVADIVAKLSTFPDAGDTWKKNPRLGNRHAYLFACGMVCGGFHQEMSKPKGK
jgi:hypothetical protein